MRKCFFFDRDGVLNKSIVKKGKPYSPVKMSELIIDEDAADIIKYLKSKNFLIIVVTNQPDVKRKKVTKDFINSIHKHLKKNLKFDDLYVCYEDNNNSFYRKPKPGMLFSAKKKWKIDLSRSFLIGDRSKDIKAGLSAGVKTVFLDNDYEEKKPMFSHYRIKRLKEIKKII
jgi:D-glycero-D-manno-heptose 1,7-bisphosphate phosphatase